MEHTMATLYLTEPHTLVKKDGDTLVVHIPADEEKQQPKRKVRVPLLKIDRVVVQGDSTLTTPAITALMDKHAEVTFLDRYGRYTGHLAPTFTRNGQLRLAQMRMHDQTEQQLTLATQFVRGKLTNMRTMLLRFNRKHQNERLTTAAASIKGSLAELDQLDLTQESPDPTRPQKQSAYGRLHGLEGHATSHYFACWKTILNQPDLFNGRTRRPPRDPANALLSYGYTILLNQVMSSLCLVGLDPYVGYLHGSRFGKPALALDLMEEFRPLIVDSVVTKLLNQHTLKPKDFIEEFGTYRLTDHGRRTFLTTLEARFDETIKHPTFDYKATYRRSLELQARLLAKFIMQEIDTYPPFITR